jgi:hypothetical protein
MYALGHGDSGKKISMHWCMETLVNKKGVHKCTIKTCFHFVHSCAALMLHIPNQTTVDRNKCGTCNLTVRAGYLFFFVIERFKY